ncbi:g5030 [Coccomyxa viridis]|uniref:G5030 protein n=1 Tax=Coccomyxa viridis TaxID=1274662 RepID=A0ABP1FRT0_9CHLO
MAHRLANISRLVRTLSGWSGLPAAHSTGVLLTPSLCCTTNKTWHSALPGIALLLAGASTVCSCEDESRSTAPTDPADVQPPVSNEHTAKWRIYTNKAAQLAKEHKLEDAEKFMSAALSEAVKGFGMDDPHTAAARQNLAEQYRVMHKYDLALPLYNEAVSSLMEAYGLQDIRTATALHNLAGLHMARKDAQAASQTMQRAIEAKRLALGPTHPAVAESVLGLAAIHRASGCPTDAIELLQKETNFLMKEEKASSPGAVVLARRLAEDQKEAGMLSEAETTCRGLCSILRDALGTPGSNPLLLSDVTLELARVVRAQGRLDEARQLCEQANSLNLAGQRALGYWPALQLLVEIELEVGSPDSHLRALNRLQTFRESMQAMLDEALAASDGGSQRVWHQPVTWLRGWRQGEDSKVHLQHVLIFEAVLAEVHQHLAQVQSRLGRHLEAWATLTQAIEALRSPVLAQAIDSWALQHSTRLRERFAGLKQDIQHQMAASYKIICSPLAAADVNTEQCLAMQHQLTEALAA